MSTMFSLIKGALSGASLAIYPGTNYRTYAFLFNARSLNSYLVTYTFCVAFAVLYSKALPLSLFKVFREHLHFETCFHYIWYLEIYE